MHEKQRLLSLLSQCHYPEHQGDSVFSKLSVAIT